MKNPRDIMREVADKSGTPFTYPATPQDIEQAMRIWHIQESEREAEERRTTKTIKELWKQETISYDDLELNLNLVKESADYNSDFKTCCSSPGLESHKTDSFTIISRCQNCGQVVIQFPQQTDDLPYGVYTEPTKDKPLIPLDQILDFKSYLVAWDHMVNTQQVEDYPYQNVYQAIGAYIIQLRKKGGHNA